MTSMQKAGMERGFPCGYFMKIAIMRISFLRAAAALVFGGTLAIGSAAAQQAPAQPANPYGGSTVEDIVARVNDQIITNSDYQHALDELQQEDQSRGDTMQQEADDRRNLLRNLIDQQLWLSKGKELGVNGDTELIKRLDEIRKQYNLASIDDLEKAAKEQGVSFEDFKQNIRNQIITQDVMRQEVGSKIQFTPGEAEQYYDQHKQDYMQPESVRLSEILVSTGSSDNPDPATLAKAKAKADDIEARLNSGGDFAQLARSFSDGQTASEGGDLGQYRRGSLGKVIEDQAFALKDGQWTEPIRTRQGYLILKVLDHTPAGVAPYKQVQEQVEEALYMSRMEPAIRAYLTTMRDQAFIDIKPGYVDTGASPGESKPVFSAYVPPAPKKRGKVERTRFRENTRGFRQKSPQYEPVAAQTPAPNNSAAAPDNGSVAQAKGNAAKTKGKKKNKEVATEKPGKREKIRFGQAPRETLPPAVNSTGTENAGALPETAQNEPENPLEPTRPEHKMRFTDLARHKKQKATQAAQPDRFAPAPPDAAEAADRQTQSAPLGLGGNTAAQKKKKTSTGEKTRYSQQKNKQGNTAPVQMTPAAPVAGAPAPASQTQQPQQ
jgi:peptidyl-prolyl cis-trans isomerase SurA